MIDYAALAAVAYAYAEQHYSDKDARFDVIVECYSISDLAKEMEYARVSDEAGARRWADEAAGLQHEVELNQAWDGPESVKSSSRYDPAHDPAGPLLGPPFQPIREMDDHGQPVDGACPACGKPDCNEQCPEMDEAMRPDFIEHIDSYTGHPVYSVNSARARAMIEEQGK